MPKSKRRFREEGCSIRKEKDGAVHLLSPGSSGRRNRAAGRFSMEDVVSMMRTRTVEWCGENALKSGRDAIMGFLLVQGNFVFRLLNS